MNRTSSWLLLVLVGITLALIPSTISHAQDESPITDDQVNKLASDLYCPVCENVPLDVCPTVACAQWRDLIREKMELGWSEQQIKDYFALQYGDQVLAVPPARGFNWLIYVIPPLILIGGIAIVANVVTKSRQDTTRVIQEEKLMDLSNDDEVINEVERDLKRTE
jgi:cytochrome c-type biogenesis protein CcmH